MACFTHLLKCLLSSLGRGSSRRHALAGHGKCLCQRRPVLVILRRVPSHANSAVSATNVPIWREHVQHRIRNVENYVLQTSSCDNICSRLTARTISSTLVSTVSDLSKRVSNFRQFTVLFWSLQTVVLCVWWNFGLKCPIKHQFQFVMNKIIG